MGSGASSKKKDKYQPEAVPEPNLDEAPLVKKKPSDASSSTGGKPLTRFQRIQLEHSNTVQEEMERAQRTCERCGIKHRVSQVEENRWLCQPCNEIDQREKMQRAESETQAAKPATRGSRARLLPGASRASALGASAAEERKPLPSAQEVKKVNRRAGGKDVSRKLLESTAKDSAKLTPITPNTPQAVRRSGTMPPDAPDLVRSPSRGSTLAGTASSKGFAASEPAPRMAVPAGAGTTLPGGYSCGEAVQSLVGGLREGKSILESGQEGCIVGLSREYPGGPDEEARYLVQFSLGFDWTLSPNQLCRPAHYAIAWAQGLPGGYKWGDRVKSLVIQLQNTGERTLRVIFGDSGLVIGPGYTRGKLAVRFDNGSSVGEWSVWPSMVCREEDFQNDARLAGGYRLGDLVQTHGHCRGARASGNRKWAIEPGELGIVIGPGHAQGRLLVHMDGTGRNWSLSPNQVVRVEDSDVGAAQKAAAAFPDAAADPPHVMSF